MIGGEGEVSMLSSRGNITVDERTNSLLIRDLPSNIDIIKGIVEALDIPVKQVQIEARIVTVNEGNLRDLGVRWGWQVQMVTFQPVAALKARQHRRELPVVEMILILLVVVIQRLGWMTF